MEFHLYYHQFSTSKILDFSHWSWHWETNHMDNFQSGTDFYTTLSDFFQRCALSCLNMTRDLAKWLCPFWKAAHFTHFFPLIFKVQSAFWNPGITNLLASVQICRNKIPYKLCFSFYWSDVRGNYLYHFDYWWFWCLSLDI